MMLYLNLTIKDDIVVKYESILKSVYQEFDLRITKVEENDDTTFNKTDLNLHEISIVDKIYFKNADAIYKENNLVNPISILGTDIQQLIDNKLIIIQKLSPDFFDYSIIISQRTQEKYQLEIGDSISVVTTDGPRQYLVDRKSVV